MATSKPRRPSSSSAEHSTSNTMCYYGNFYGGLGCGYRSLGCGYGCGYGGYGGCGYGGYGGYGYGCWHPLYCGRYWSYGYY
ncbi:keratin-associated protein 20-1-like [Oryctolagus cuniculus]|uniref:keratin-associated protein 20-1-like n=1 Tax=Oryctolagus cuniculus TaxID=9986 RepID=UPI0022309765|nr:keratin-associated protein 20-1-like [Oryctolagus cuniculus]